MNWTKALDKNEGESIPAHARTVTEWAQYWDIPRTTASGRIHEALRKGDLRVYEGYIEDNRGAMRPTKFYEFI